MSSMSVVNGTRLVDVNEDKLPQDVSIDKNLDDILSSEEEKNKIRFSISKDNLSVTYPDVPNNKVIDFQVGSVIHNRSGLAGEDANKIEQSNSFASYFVPSYTFLKGMLPKFTLPDLPQFNFTPLVGFFDSILNTLSSACASIYDTGELIFNSTVGFVKDVGESAFNTSVDFGKSIISTVSGFFSNIISGSDENTDNSANNVQSDAPIVSNNIVQQSQDEKDEQIEDKDFKKPYWYPLNKLNASNSNSEIPPGRRFQSHFNELRKTIKLDNNFLFEGKDSILQVNGQRISKSSPENMLDDFKHVLPNLESRQLISSYSNQDLFSQPYIELFSQRPELSKLKLRDVNVSYVVDELNDGNFQLVATSKSKLHSSYKADGRTYDSFGIQASMTLSKDKIPSIEYVYFLM
ncbi:MAG: hypothetical protein U0T63_02705 [Buchnera aphidicola (Nurudea shiraii)]